MESNSKKRKQTSTPSRALAVGDDQSDLDVQSKAEPNDEGPPKPKKKRTTQRRKTKENFTKVFPFLSLPAELRNKIYGYALSEGAPDQDGRGETVKIVAKSQPKYRQAVFRQPPNLSLYERLTLKKNDKRNRLDETVSNKFNPALLRVCKQIQKEATPILYGHVFNFADRHALTAFISQINQVARDCLQNIELYTWDEGNGLTSFREFHYISTNLLATCNNIKSVRMLKGHPIKRHVSGKQIAERIYQGMRTFLESYAAAKGVDAAVGVLDVSAAYFGPLETWDKQKEEYFSCLRGSLRLREDPCSGARHLENILND